MNDLLKNCLGKFHTDENCLNDSANALTWYAWYGMEYDLDKALHYTKEALYWMEWYYERPRLYVFDTALEVLNKAGDPSLYICCKKFHLSL